VTALLLAERERLQREIENLVALVATGAGVDATAAQIRTRQVELAKLDVRLRTARPERPNIDRCGRR
jgi:hypothetical protein